MKVFTNTENLSKALTAKNSKKTIGFVPTMGALHKGHLSLVSQALVDNDCAVVSVFVNPTQFGNAGDLKNYPRTLDKDVELLKTLQGSIYVFAPVAEELYEGVVVPKYFKFGAIANEMEGKHRHGHFNGVGTVVSLLLKAVKPTRAYFGQKDFQQLQIVKKLVHLDKLPVDIVGCPIVREHNGLAMSSRNKRLSKEQFEAATIISKTLKEVKDHFNDMSISQLNTLANKRFMESKLLELEYFEIANEATLKTVKRKRKGTTYRGFIAAFAGEVRLIDNMQF